MEELFKELKNYLKDNFIPFSCQVHDNSYMFQIDEKIYELSVPNEDGRFFDESFNWDCDRTDLDGYIFNFGSVWYTLQAGNEKAVKLDRVKWRGKIQVTEEALLQRCFLGVHGPFELMNGSGSYKDWCSKAKWMGIESLGICEKGTLAGTLKFQTACEKAGIRPILGMEIPIQVAETDSRYTIKAFVKNEQGWINLLWINKLINVDSTENYLSEKDVFDHKEGLIFIYDPKTTDFGILPTEIWLNKENYYQLDPIEYKKEERDEAYLKNLRKFYNTKMKPVLMSDAYYLEKEYAPIRVKLNRLAGTMNYESDSQYFKNGEELWFEYSDLFKKNFEGQFDTFSAAMENLEEICDACQFTVETKQRHLPKYYMTPEESKLYKNNEEMFVELVYKGVEEHIDLLEDWGEDVLAERIEREIKVIRDGDVIDYFLSLRDIVNWCRQNQILLGAGRGCFLPGQKVLLKDGNRKNIEEVSIGDSLQTYWSENNPVVNKFEYDCNEQIVELEFEGEKKIRCTKDHEFYTSNRGWVKADELTEEDNVIYIGPIIYKAVNNVTGEIYIGKTTQGLEKRIVFHKKDFKNKEIRTPFYKAIEKYGWESFSWEIIEFVDKDSDLNDRERFHIEQYRSKFGELIYNIAPGGDGGNLYNEMDQDYLASIKKKISTKVKSSERWNEKNKREFSLKMKGNKIMTPELCKKFSERSSLSYIVQLSKQGELLQIFDSPLDLKEKTGFIINSINSVAGKSNKSYKGYRWQKFKKDEITKEEIYKLFGKSL